MLTKDKIRAIYGTLPKCCKAWGISRPTLNKWVREGRIPEVSTSAFHNGRPWQKEIEDKGVDPINIVVIDESKVKESMLG